MLAAVTPNMMTKWAFIVIMMLLMQVICARDIKATTAKITTSFRIPANLSYDELVYITQVRSGGVYKRPKTLSPCARAILGCCKDKVMNENCSESLKCGAFFFDDNPCDDKFILDALKAARSFYEQFNTVTTKTGKVKDFF